MDICKFDGCDREKRANGYCSKHNSRLRKFGDPALCGTGPIDRTIKYCKLDDCEHEHYAKGYCRKHYNSFRLSGHPKGSNYLRRRREMMIALKAAGQTYAEIASGFGLSRQRVQQIVSPTEEERESIYQKFGQKCFFCESPGNDNGFRLDLHHIFSKGGKASLVPLCTACHLKIEHIVAITD